jgi:hypothetical protein
MKEKWDPDVKKGSGEAERTDEKAQSWYNPL